MRNLPAGEPLKVLKASIPVYKMLAIPPWPVFIFPVKDLTRPPVAGNLYFSNRKKIL